MSVGEMHYYLIGLGPAAGFPPALQGLQYSVVGAFTVEDAVATWRANVSGVTARPETTGWRTVDEMIWFVAAVDRSNYREWASTLPWGVRDAVGRHPISPAGHLVASEIMRECAF